MEKASGCNVSFSGTTEPMEVPFKRFIIGEVDKG
jgi:hypothetical protein